MRWTVLALLALVACASETIPRPSGPPVDWASLETHAAIPDAGVISATAMERAAGDNYIAALMSDDFNGLGNVLDEDAYFTFAGLHDVHGRNNIIIVHRSLLGNFDQRKIVVSRRFLTESAQILEWTLEGVDHASRKPTAFRGLVILRTNDDGSIGNVHLYYDEGLTQAGTAAMPTGPRVEIEQTHDQRESENVGTVRALLDALEAKNADGYVAAMTDDVEVTTLEADRAQHGKADARKYVKMMNTNIAGLDTSIDDIWGIGDFVIVEYHVVGEQKGPLGRIPAQKDNLLKMFDVDVVQLKDHKISHIWRYDNPAQLLVEAQP